MLPLSHVTLRPQRAVFQALGVCAADAAPPHLHHAYVVAVVCDPVVVAGLGNQHAVPRQQLLQRLDALGGAAGKRNNRDTFTVRVLCRGISRSAGAHPGMPPGIRVGDWTSMQATTLPHSGTFAADG